MQITNVPFKSLQQAREFYETYKKKLTKRFVFPAMTTVALLWYAAYVDLTRDNWLWFLLLCAGGFVFNIAFTMLDFRIRLGKWSLHNRSETIDVLRWIVNFIIFDGVAFTIFTPTPLGQLGIWVMLITVALADTSRRSAQLVISVIGVLTPAVLFLTLHPEVAGWEFAFALSVLIAHTAIINISEHLWISEIHQRTAAEENERQALQREAALYVQSEKIKHDAMLGEKLRFISHEINNLMFALETARSGTFDERKQQIFHKTVDKLQGITSLILSDQSGVENRHTVNVERLIDDLQLILDKRFSQEDMTLRTEVSSAARKVRFRERKGSSFYIINNLLKNALDASRDMEQASEITLSADYDGQLLHISVTDYGKGMAQDQVERLMRSNGILDPRTSKKDGHGLGMRFVKSECKHNGFELGIESTLGRGTTVTLKIDPKRVHGSDPPQTLTA